MESRSATAFGTVVPHVAPEAAGGGSPGLAGTGDTIRLSVRGRSLDLLVDERELGRRRAKSGRAARQSRERSRGYFRLYAEEILQADEGCDFRFMLPPAE